MLKDGKPVQSTEGEPIPIFLSAQAQTTYAEDAVYLRDHKTLQIKCNGETILRHGIRFLHEVQDAYREVTGKELVITWK